MSVNLTTRIGSVVRTLWPLLSLALFIVLVTGVASAASDSLARAATTMLVNLILVVGLYTFMGHSGVFSFGHIAFMAIGAYVTAVLTIPVDSKQLLLPLMPEVLQGLHAGSLPAIVAGGLLAAVFAAMVGVPIARMSALGAALGTFAVLTIVYTVARNWEAFGRSSGVADVPITTGTGTALLWALAAMTAAFGYQQTRSCLRLRASREDEQAARGIGVSVAWDRYVAFIISALIVGIGGGVFAQQLGFFTPDSFYLDITFVTLVMLLVGGATSLAGAVVGVVSISAAREVLRDIESGWMLGPVELPELLGLESIAIALLLVVVMIKRPLGLLGGREIVWPFRDVTSARARRYREP